MVQILFDYLLSPKLQTEISGNKYRQCFVFLCFFAFVFVKSAAVEIRRMSVEEGGNNEYPRDPYKTAFSAICTQRNSSSGCAVAPFQPLGLNVPWSLVLMKRYD